MWRCKQSSVHLSRPLVSCLLPWQQLPDVPRRCWAFSARLPGPSSAAGSHPPASASAAPNRSGGQPRPDRWWPSCGHLKMWLKTGRERSLSIPLAAYIQGWEGWDQANEVRAQLDTADHPWWHHTVACKQNIQNTPNYLISALLLCCYHQQFTRRYHERHWTPMRNPCAPAARGHLPPYRRSSSSSSPPWNTLSFPSYRSDTPALLPSDPLAGVH